VSDRQTAIQRSSTAPIARTTLGAKFGWIYQWEESIRKAVVRGQADAYQSPGIHRARCSVDFEFDTVSFSRS